MKSVQIILFILLFSATWSNINAQSPNVVKANFFLTSGELDKAVEYIDVAIENTSTNKLSKTWFLRGNIYYKMIHKNDDEPLSSYKYLQKSFESYQHAFDLNTGDFDQKLARQNLNNSANFALNFGVKEFNEKAYNNAFDFFKVSESISSYLGLVDSLVYYNLALAAEKNQNYNEAINWYRKCIDINYNFELNCLNIIYLLKVQGNHAEIDEQFKYCYNQQANNDELVSLYTGHLLKIGEQNKAIQVLTEAIKNNPKNEVYYFVLGSIYQSQKQETLAIENFKTSIQLRSNYFDPEYNLGALYFNKGVELNNTALDEENEIKQENLFDEAEIAFKKAMTHLEKAHSYKPKDRNTMQSLLLIYQHFNYAEKYNTIINKMNQ